MVKMVRVGLMKRQLANKASEKGTIQNAVDEMNREVHSKDRVRHSETVLNNIGPMSLA